MPSSGCAVLLGVNHEFFKNLLRAKQGMQRYNGQYAKLLVHSNKLISAH